MREKQERSRLGSDSRPSTTFLLMGFFPCCIKLKCNRLMCTIKKVFPRLYLICPLENDAALNLSLRCSEDAVDDLVIHIIMLDYSLQTATCFNKWKDIPDVFLYLCKY